MTDELIEQVARAIGQITEGPAEDMSAPWYGKPLWTAYTGEARAALAAIDLPARLEAARTQGWNEAIEAAAEAYETGTGYAPGKLPSQRIRALTKENSDETR